MPAPAAWPTRKNNPLPSDDGHGRRQALPPSGPADQVAAHVVVSNMADLLRDTRWSMVTDGCLLGAVATGLALEAGHYAGAGQPVLAGVVNLSLLAGILVCWLTAACLLAWAGRPVLNAVSELRWRTGSPLDPRPKWVNLPPVGADPADWTWERAYLLVGAASWSWYRTHFADTWTYLAGGCFLALTMLVMLGW